MNNSTADFFDKKNQVLGHPAGLFVLFFTEMWERFSFYGMRALLVLFLVSSVGIGGWDWPRENALSLYGTYLALLYLTPIIGGQLADRYLGYRKAIIIGAVIITLGHASMAIEHIKAFMYIGLLLLVIGTGFFKPNMTSFISVLYQNHPEKKDGAYTIFYMGVNSGSFLGIMLCGYLGETFGWSWGFGLAGIFMLLGLLQFTLSHKIFGDVSMKPTANDDTVESDTHEKIQDKPNPFTLVDKIIMFVVATLGLIWVINDPIAKISHYNILEIGGKDMSNNVIIVALIMFLYLLVSRTLRYSKITRDRMFAVMIIASLIIFFWASFEQAGGSMSIFAKDYTNRVLAGNYALAFNIVDIIITVVPVAIISYVLFLLIKKTYKKFLLANTILGVSFLIIWSLIFWKIYYGFNTYSYQVSIPETEDTVILTADQLKPGDNIYVVDVDKKGKNFKQITAEKAKEVSNSQVATIVEKKENQIEIPATWFGILNSLFIIIFAPLMSKWWESRFNPSLAGKYAIGLFFLAAGFGFLAFGARDIPNGATAASVSFIWLVLAYFLHTLGELCVQPVGLSSVSKLVPPRMVAFMFGVWYLALAIGNKTSGKMGEMIDQISKEHGISSFFLIFTIVPAIIGVIALLLHPLLKRLMHGIK
ncbi:peptide MFS transporter [Ornithobacterium rhinotracheale]|uniref:peptide MFS transporter n=1 Tax=Ornithobacterium rhinotracheale TaxID=28251 RepID=UPI003FA4270D